MEEKKEFFVVIDNVRSMENIGSIFRTSDALGVTKIYLCGISGKLAVGQTEETLKQRLNKTALGAEKTIPFEYCYQTGRLLEKLKKEGIETVALEQDKKSVDYRAYQPKFPLALVVGNEVDGVSRSVLQKVDHIIHLPMVGEKESLNVSVAFGVAGYELQKHVF